VIHPGTERRDDPRSTGGKSLCTALEVFRSELLSETCPWLRHGFSARRGGVSASVFASLNLGLHVGDSAASVLENRRRFIHAALGPAADPGRAIAAEQVHGGAIARVKEIDAGRGALTCASAITGVDALATDCPSLPLMLFFADCVPVLIAHPARRVFCVVHAGWRGTAAGIAAEAVRFLAAEFNADPGEFAAWIAPAIGSCCYEVDETVARAVNGYINNYDGRPIVRKTRRLDLKAVNRKQLEGAGVQPDRIEVSPACSSCLPEQFFSYRRDGATGRMGLAALID